MNYKEFRVEYKDEGSGTLEGYASTWIKRPDSYGDIVKEGAFSRTLEERWNGGKGIPLLWAHQMDNLNSFIGKADAEEDEKGLHFVATFDDTEEAQRVRNLYKDGRLSKFSFAFDVRDNGTVTLEDGTKANELRDLDLFEISCVCVPANDDAGVVDVKAGRRNRKSDAEILKQIRSLVDQLLEDEVDDPEDDDVAEDQPKDNAEIEAEDQPVDNALKQRLLEAIKKDLKEA